MLPALSREVGHNGAAVLFGGRTVSLPYCNQAVYANQTGLASGIALGSHAYVTIDGNPQDLILGCRKLGTQARQFVIRGAVA